MKTTQGHSASATDQATTRTRGTPQRPIDAHCIANRDARITEQSNELVRLQIQNRALLAALQNVCGAFGNDSEWWDTEGEHRFQNQIDNDSVPYPTAHTIRAQVLDEGRAAIAKAQA